ncbi:bacillithiol biosynthesis deacetylase BshB1 [Bremerella cremea]
MSVLEQMKTPTPLDILVIAPHPDDAELGMGGAILKFKAEGKKVGILDLTSGEPTPYGSPEKRAAETAAATDILKVDWRDNLGLPNRSLEPTLAAREKLASVFRLLRPKWLFAPYWEDAHPDHLAATQLVDAARFWSKLSKTEMPGEPFHPQRIYNYYCVHLKMAAQPAFVLDISEHWEEKLASIRCYHSQFIEGRPTEYPTFLDKLHDEASYWGKVIGTRYGEPFTSREPIGLSSMDSLV